MERKLYEPTEKQLEKWSIADATVRTMPTDEEFKAAFKKRYRKTTGWGMMKRDWVVSEMKNTTEYQRGIWQGRVDAAQGLEYGEKEDESTYNLGYYRGYTEYKSRGTRGWDKAQAAEFESKYAI